MNQYVLQEVKMVIDANTTIYGYAPQYLYDEDKRDYVNITTAMPHWSIKKVLVNGNTTITRWAEGDNYHNKILDKWNTYTY